MKFVSWVKSLRESAEKWYKENRYRYLPLMRFFFWTSSDSNRRKCNGHFNGMKVEILPLKQKFYKILGRWSVDTMLKTDTQQPGLSPTSTEEEEDLQRWNINLNIEFHMNTIGTNVFLIFIIIKLLIPSYMWQFGRIP